MSVDFISDLHLDKTRPEVNQYFIKYLLNLNEDITDLYILGDLFEYWVGDDDPMDGLDDVRSCITKLGEKINIWYMHGNRDFLISEKICNTLKMKLLIDPTIITINGMTILLVHGDTLCTDDIAYQKFRGLVRSKEWQNEMLAKPLQERLLIADSLRKKSIEENETKDENIMDVNVSEVEKLIREYSPNIIIHGHTHRPNIHIHDVDTKKTLRYVLGDWYDKFFILTLKNKKFSVCKGRLK